MSFRRSRWPLVAALCAIAGCHDGATRPNAGLAVGESFAVTGAQSVALDPGESGGTYAAVLVNTATTAGVNESYTLRASGLAQPAPAMARIPVANAARVPTPHAPLLDRDFEGRLRDRERVGLSARMAVARSAISARRGSGAAG